MRRLYLLIQNNILELYYSFISAPICHNNLIHHFFIGKKKELYSFKAGSCFSHKFDGHIFDLSEGGNHPVYRYAKPLMMGVDINE